jgi:hypothetical protein
MLLPFKLYPTVITPIRINWHSTTSITKPIRQRVAYTKGDYSALTGD